VALARLLNPLLLGFEAFLTRLLNRPDAAGSETAPPVTGGELGPNPFENLPRWPFDLARDVMIVIVVGVAALGLVIFLLLYLERVRKTGLQDEDEEEGRSPASFGGGIVDRALGSLRNAAGLIQRFGISRELLAAISVQNIYANLCRLARQRGKPRLASQPPDAYLPILAQAFPGEEERLRHITSAYMRVHYGDHPVGSEELAALREDYRVLLEARPTD
jgi:Domain of unknown function (DUF4129)